MRDPIDETADQASDADLFAASLARPLALAEVFDRHAPELLRYLTRRIGPADAEDILGEVFVVALERRADFDPVASSARPWLYGIASRLLMRRRRDERRFLSALARHGEDRGTAIFEDEALDRVHAAHAGDTIAAALAALSAEDRAVLLLVAWTDLTQLEIAAALQIPVGTVKSRLNRARSAVRPRLEAWTHLHVVDEAEGNR